MLRARLRHVTVEGVEGGEGLEAGGGGLEEGGVVGKKLREEAEVGVQVRDSAAEQCALLHLHLHARPSRWREAASRVAAALAALRRGGG